MVEKARGGSLDTMLSLPENRAARLLLGTLLDHAAAFPEGVLSYAKIVSLIKAELGVSISHRVLEARCKDSGVQAYVDMLLTLPKELRRGDLLRTENKAWANGTADRLLRTDPTIAKHMRPRLHGDNR